MLEKWPRRSSPSLSAIGSATLVDSVIARPRMIAMRATGRRNRTPNKRGLQELFHSCSVQLRDFASQKLALSAAIRENGSRCRPPKRRAACANWDFVAHKSHEADRPSGALGHLVSDDVAPGAQQRRIAPEPLSETHGEKTAAAPKQHLTVNCGKRLRRRQSRPHCILFHQRHHGDGRCQTSVEKKERVPIPKSRSRLATMTLSPK